MAATSAILVGVGGAVYSGIQANQDRQRAKGQANAILSRAPSAAGDAAMANTAALDAQRKQRQKTAGIGTQNGTLLTGPQGAPALPPAPKTLLGL